MFDKPNAESRTTLRAAVRLKVDFGIPNTEWFYLNDFEARMGMYNAKIIVSVVTSNESDNLLEDAIKILDNKEKGSIEKAKIVHDAWWKSFWERSFVSIPDDYIQNIYYYRRYLTASAPRASFPIVFNGSLWTKIM